jgi:hypothetical protein
VKAKAIKDLSQLSDNELFAQASEGLDLIIEHTLAVEADAKFLAEQNRRCGLAILGAILKEEAAKFLILVDAIRCPRVPPDEFSRQLGRFNDHLAKGVYSLVYGLHFISFGEIDKFIQRECQAYYLDGPNDYDWIFRNEIIQRREETIYVDYIETDENHVWITPKRFYQPDMHVLGRYYRPEALEVAEALWQAGCTKPESLSHIAKMWRPIRIPDDFTQDRLRELNIRTLEELNNSNLLSTQEEQSLLTIVNKWSFPLYSLKIRIIEVDKETLKETRDNAFFLMYY